MHNKMVLEVNNVSFAYKDGKTCINVLNDINLSINEQEFVCFLGPSGCGKSTLLNLIAGFIKPVSGIVKMDGENITKPDWKIGVVFQNPALYPWLNVRQNVEFGLKARKINKKEINKLSSTYLDEVGLSDFSKSKPYELSGGMRQRVSFARVLVNHPRLVLLDEPFSALDAFTRVGMQNFTRDIWKNSKSTFAMVTHDVDEALSLGTRIVVISRRPGQIIANKNVNFTNSFEKNSLTNVQSSDEYINLKREILEMIYTEANESIK